MTILSVRFGMFILMLMAASTAIHSASAATVVDFESLPFGFNSDDVNVGPFADNVTSVPGTFGGNDIGSTFSTGGVTFNNTFNDMFGSFGGFTASQRGLDRWSSGGFAEFGNGNDLVNRAGSGASGSSTWLVANGDNFQPGIGGSTFQDIGPIMLAPTGSVFDSVFVNNTETAAFVLQTGNFSARAFGSIDQDESFVARFVDLSPGADGSSFVEVELASFDSATNSLSILSDWTRVDLSGLGGATRIGIDFDSTDVGGFGVNTPAYIALDNLTIVAVPEPSSIALALAFCVFGVVRWKVRKTAAANQIILRQTA